MGAIVGKRASKESGDKAELLPIHRTRFRYLYQFHPLRWYYDEADAAEGNDGWLPVLGQLNISPGVNGVADGNVIDAAVLRNQRDGWTIIDDHDKRLGEFSDYMQRFPARGPAVWASIFESVRVVGNRAMWSFDADRYRRFLRHLVDKGIVPQIDDAIREAKVDDLRAQIEGMEGRLANSAHNPALENRIGIKKRLLAGMLGEAPPATKRRRSKTDAAEVPA